jgi:tRNA1Val (adenine37-N6)-methyltransferase
MSFDSLLGGRVQHAQGTDGHRTGIEPVLLAAFVPARAGERVLEGGTGAGAALLCLASRVPGMLGVGLELNAEQAVRARENFALNGFDSLVVVHGDLAAIELESRFDHAMANPPWHTPSATASPDGARALAKQARPGLFALWAERLARTLRHRGTLSFITSTATLSECLAAFSQAGCGSHTILPLWPREGKPSKLVLLQGVKDGRGPTQVMPGLVLHAPGGGYTAAAEAVLRDGHALRP